MPKHFYPLLIITLLGSFLLFSGWSAYRTSTQGSQVTDRDYYSKGLKYNSTLVEKRAASVLGWQLKTSLRDGQLEIKLLDGKGAPVAGAKGQLTFYLPTDRSTPSLLLHETAPGNYRVQLPASLKGEVNVRIVFESEGARINRQLLLNI